MNDRAVIGDNDRAVIGDNDRAVIGDNDRAVIGDNDRAVIGDNDRAVIGDNDRAVIGDNDRAVIGDNDRAVIGDNDRAVIGDNDRAVIGDNDRAVIGDNDRAVIGDNDRAVIGDNDRAVIGDNDRAVIGDNDRAVIGDNDRAVIGDNDRAVIGDNDRAVIGDNDRAVIGDNDRAVIGDNDRAVIGDNDRAVIGDNDRAVIGDNDRAVIGDNDRAVIGDNDRAVIGDNDRAVIGDNDRAVIGDNDRAVIGDNDRAVIGDNDRAVIGDSPRRREDARFVTGSGAYLDDLRFEGMAHAVFLRSPHAHARISAIHTADALASPGIIAILTAEDAAADGLRPMRPTVEANVQTNEPFRFLPQPLLAADTVRYAGEPVALIVAETKHQALDTAERIIIDYEPLPAITQAQEAVEPEALLVSDVVPDNCCLDWTWGQTAEVAGTIKTAPHVVTIMLNNHRIVTNPMEPRGAIGLYDGRYTLHVSSQNIHGNRDVAARALGVDSSRVRFIAPDVGGGFGAKNFAYAEHALILWAARRTGRVVKWIATRSETFLSDHQARDHFATATLALGNDGKFLALHVDSIANLGAYMAGGSGGVQTNQYPHLQGTVYNLPAIALRVRAVLTNTTPIGVTRGPGFGEAVNIMERLIDAAAAQCGFDRIALRRRNFVTSTPMTNAFNFVVDSGDFRAAFDTAVTKADLSHFPDRRRNSEANGKRRGVGLACHIKATGGLPKENIDIRFERDGTVSLITGTQTIGQGHETTMPQILADRLGLPNALIRLKQGDTDLIPMGGGHGSSRATYMGGTAIWRASDIIIVKGKVIASHALEAAEADIVFEDGSFRVAGTDRTITLLEAAARARESNEPLDTYYQWTREAMTFPNGTHIVEVEVDSETGAVTLERLTAVDDYGVIVNPMIATGQAHGAIAQGAGQALLEHAVYDPESGQPISGSFMDYSMPRAADLTCFDLSFAGTRCTTNPVGVKGCGEAGAIAVFPAIGNAIADAVGVTTLDGPASGNRVWRAMRQSRLDCNPAGDQ